MIKNFLLGLLIIAFNKICFGQDFNVKLNHRGNNNHSALTILEDSSFISLTPVSYYNTNTLSYDTTRTLIVRHSKDGTIMYYKSIKSPPDYSISILNLCTSGNKIFLSGRIDFTDSAYGFLMRLDECLSVEKITIFRFKIPQYQCFTSIVSFSDSEVLASGPYFINSDSLYRTMFLMDHNFKPKWHRTFLADGGETLVTDSSIYLWGFGYYPRESDLNVVELKFNFTKLNKKGKILKMITENEHVEELYSQGWKIIKPANARFLIGSYSQITSKSTNELIKIKPDGTWLKKIRLNKIGDDEFPGGLTCINENRFIAIGLRKINFDTTICNAYLVDSSLNIIRQKRILPTETWIALYNSLPQGLRNEALLYGEYFNKGTSLYPKALIIKLDTFLNMAKLPNTSNYTDSLCLSPIIEELFIPTADTVWLEDLKLRDNIFLGIQHAQLLSTKVGLYPNPNSGVLNISFEDPVTGQVIVTNSLGQQLIVKAIIESDFTQIILPDTVSGVVFVTIKTQRGVVVRKVMVVR
ncbi:MAG: T9SS type A sorting domain-containing protein [Bacteroidota bacterium]